MKANARPPADQEEVRQWMTRDPYYQFWSAMQRRSQEMLWESVIDPTERQWPESVSKSQEAARGRAPASSRKRGSLRVDPNLTGAALSHRG